MVTKEERAAKAAAANTEKEAKAHEANEAAAVEAKDKADAKADAKGAPRSAKIDGTIVVESEARTAATRAVPANDGPVERARRARAQIEEEGALGTVRVRALQPGVYIGRRQIGDVFDFPIARLEEKDGKRVLPRWMELAPQG